MGVIIAIIVVISIFVAVARIDKLAKQKKDQAANEQPPPPTESGSLYYSDNPYLTQNGGKTLTAAMYDEWLRDYRAARKSGKLPPPAASPFVPTCAALPVARIETRQTPTAQPHATDAPKAVSDLKDAFCAHFIRRER